MNAMPAATSAAESYVIQGREVRLPVVVRDASSGAATYAVSAAAARRLIPGDALEPVEVWPGKALCSLAVIQYRDNDLGDYNEVSIAFFVRETGSAARAARTSGRSPTSCAAASRPTSATCRSTRASPARPAGRSGASRRPSSASTSRPAPTAPPARCTWTARTC